MCDYEAEERACFRLSLCGMLERSALQWTVCFSPMCGVCTDRSSHLTLGSVRFPSPARIDSDDCYSFSERYQQMYRQSINRTEYLSKRRPARWKRAFATFSLMDFYNCSNQMWWKQSFPVHTNVVVIFPPDDAGVAGRSQSNCSSENIGARGQKYWAQDFGNSLKE